MICQRCRRSVDDGAAFCPFCGNNLKQQMNAANAAGSSQQMLLLTANYAAGYKVDKVLGMVYGITVRSRGIGGNIVAGLRTIAGGEIREYTELALQARQEALDRLSEHARGMGANAVLSVMFDSTEMAASMEEIIAFGTAVVVSPASGDQQLVKLSYWRRALRRTGFWRLSPGSVSRPSPVRKTRQPRPVREGSEHSA